MDMTYIAYTKLCIQTNNLGNEDVTVIRPTFKLLGNYHNHLLTMVGAGISKL